MSKRSYKAGASVIVLGPEGNPSSRGVVDPGWDGVGKKIPIRIDGRVKPRLVPVNRLRADDDALDGGTSATVRETRGPAKPDAGSHPAGPALAAPLEVVTAKRNAIAPPPPAETIVPPHSSSKRSAARTLRRHHVGPVELKAIPKSKGPFRSELYLAFVRTKRCCAPGRDCEGPVEAHHWSEKSLAKALGVKGHDTRTIPLCKKHHQQFHDQGRVGSLDVIGTRICFLERQAQLQTEWIVWLHTREYIDPISEERPEQPAQPPLAGGSARSSEVGT